MRWYVIAKNNGDIRLLECGKERDAEITVQSLYIVAGIVATAIRATDHLDAYRQAVEYYSEGNTK